MRIRLPVPRTMALSAKIGTIFALISLLSCAGPTPGRLATQDYSGRIVAPPAVRVLLARGQVVLSCSAECLLISDGIRDGFTKLESLPSSPVSLEERGLMLGDQSLGAREFTLTPMSYAFISVGQIPYPGSIRVIARDDGEMLVILLADVETYLAGVLPSEMPSRWPTAALMAQAVAARTYALNRVKERADALYDLEATTADQVYSGWQPLGDSVKDALRRTRGIVMLRDGRLFTAYFHSTCGGRTLDAEGVMPASDAAFIRGVECGFCADSKRFSWQTAIARADLAKRLRAAGRPVREDFRLRLRRSGEVVSEVTISDGDIAKLSLDDFARIAGSGPFPSRRFDVAEKDGIFTMSGKGFGHGVGMCQWGARGMALAGWEFDGILAHYYGDVELARIY